MKPRRTQRIPRFPHKQDYCPHNVKKRLEWLEASLQHTLPYMGGTPVPSEHFQGNIENLIGVTQIPIGIAGPLLVNGQHASGEFFVPLATTEGVLVTAYSIGMRIVGSAGGVTTRAYDHGVHITPCFFTENLANAESLKQCVENDFQTIKSVAESTTRHGKLLSLRCHFFDRMLGITFYYDTGDAMGLNMINVATEEACKFIARKYGYRFFIRSNFSADKKISIHSLASQFGKSVFVEAIIPRSTLLKLKITPEMLYQMWKVSTTSSLRAETIGSTTQAANAIAAMFLACGQDLAELNISTIVYDGCDINENGDLYFSVMIPSLVIGTVGGGTGVGTNKECLEILGCYGTGKVLKLAEIIGATVLCGEIITLGSVVNHSFVSGHQKMGRNKPV